jgi:hypothetical protein
MRLISSSLSRRWGGMAAALVMVAWGHPADGQSGSLFPEPFEVEHYLAHDDGEGGRFVSEPVVDTYGGSWIVSRRPDGSRLIVDLARRELTEVRPEKGVYWTVSFDRFGELQHRWRAAQGLSSDGSGEEGDRGAGLVPREAGQTPRSGDLGEEVTRELVVRELPASEGASLRRAAALVAVGDGSGRAIALRPGVRRLQVAHPEEGPEAALEVWVDPSVRLGPSALGAVAAFEREILGAPDAGASVAASPGSYLAAARSHAGGAFPVLSTRPAGLAADGTPVGRVEDVVTRLESLGRFPRELVEVPEGLRRVPHPLEAVVRFLEEERGRDEVMSGRRRSGASGG